MLPLLPLRLGLLTPMLVGSASLVSLIGVAETQASLRVAAEERGVAKTINVHRARHGRPPLRMHRGLGRAARVHARAMARHGFMAHHSLDGTPFDVRVRRFARPRIVGEVLARLPAEDASARTVVRAWLRSPPHRAILLSARMRRVGVARVATGGDTFYAADLGAGFPRRGRTR